MGGLLLAAGLGLPDTVHSPTEAPTRRRWVGRHTGLNGSNQTSPIVRCDAASLHFLQFRIATGLAFIQLELLKTAPPIHLRHSRAAAASGEHAQISTRCCGLCRRQPPADSHRRTRISRKQCSRISQGPSAPATDDSSALHQT